MLRYEPHSELEIYWARQRELEKRLEIARLMADGTPDGPGLPARLLSRAGDLLIAAGLALKRRCEPTAQEQSARRAMDCLVWE